MGRPESKISTGDVHLRAFASELRALRRQAGSPSYRDLAAKAHFSPSALSRAANGQVLPTLAVTLAFVSACDGDTLAWEQRWMETAARVAAQPAQPDDMAV